MEVDDALGRLGTWGRWQVLYFCMLSTATMFPACWHMLAIVFIGKTFNRSVDTFNVDYSIFAASKTTNAVKLHDISLSDPMFHART